MLTIMFRLRTIRAAYYYTRHTMRLRHRRVGPFGAYVGDLE